MAIDLHAPIHWTPLLHGVRRGFAWWRAELKACVPITWRARSRRPGQLASLALSVEEWRLCGQDEAEAFSSLQARLVALTTAQTGQAIEVRLPSEAVLERRLQVPHVALEQIRKMCTLQIERLSPLPLSQTRWDAAVVMHPSGTRQGVCAIVDAARLLPVLDALRKAGVRSFLVRDAQARFTFVREDPDRHLRRWLAGSLLALSAVLVGAGFAIDLSRVYARTETLQAEIARLRPEVELAAMRRRELERTSQMSAQISVLLSTPSPLVAWAELAAIVPDSTWLTALRIEEGEMRLEGLTREPASLLEAIAGSAILQNPRFDGPLQRQAELTADRFVLLASMRRPTP